MADSLKQEAKVSFIWNLTDKIGFQFIALLVGIFTARMLMPRDFGLIGVLAVFTLLSNILVESGFTSAMVRRERNTKNEYSAIFIINLGLSLLFYFVLFLCAPLIAGFFDMPELCSLARFLFLAIIINSCGIVPNILLSKHLQFKDVSIANMASAIISAIVTIVLVFAGFEYWALAWQQIMQVLVRTLFLWKFSKWTLAKPDFSIIREVFSFSFFLLITSLLNTIIKNIYNIVIGKKYSEIELGYYSQANKFQMIPSNVITMAISGVSYPVLARLNNEKERQLLYFRKIIRITAFLIFPVMIILFSMLNDFIEIVLTAKWLPAVPFFKILVVSAIISPFHSLNMNILVVKGFSKLYFRLESFRNILCVVFLLLMSSTIEQMLIGYSLASIISYLVDVVYVQRKISYKITQQFKDILPYFIISAMLYFIIKGIALFEWNRYLIVFIQLSTAVIFYLGSLKLLGSKILDDFISLIPKVSRKEKSEF